MQPIGMCKDVEEWINFSAQQPCIAQMKTRCILGLRQSNRLCTVLDRLALASIVDFEKAGLPRKW